MSPSPDESRTDSTSRLGVVVIAHADPVQLARLLRSLAPLPTVVHCDRRTQPAVYSRMQEGAPGDVVFARRYATPWGSLASVRAELWAIREIIGRPGIRHVAVLSGSDYPTARARELSSALREYEGRSLIYSFPLPYGPWGAHGGLDRFDRVHWRVGRRDVSLPIARPLPAGLAKAGSAVQKILSREHASRILRALDDRPEIMRHWRRVWLPDETLVASLLHGDDLVCDAHVDLVQESPWYVDWSAGGPSPKWLDLSDLPAITRQRSERAARGGAPLLFVRKVGTRYSGPLLDFIDREWAVRSD